MSLLRQLRESVRNENLTEAHRIASKIEASNYPQSLKAEATKLFNKLGRQVKATEDACGEDLYQAITTQHNSGLSNVAPPWLPWRIIHDGLEISNQTTIPSVALEAYLDTYHAKGSSALHYLKKPSIKTVESIIGKYFDHKYYRQCHPDIAHASHKDALHHYAVFGGNEKNRKPNRLFSNEDLLTFYPWVNQFDINSLYLFVRWPEQFPDVVELVRKRYALSKRKIILPWSRPAALTTIKSDMPLNTDYRRVVGITKESSSPQRLIAPNAQSLNIHVVIPDFTAGGGGHMTIFRIIMHLEEAGHTCTVWVKDYDCKRHPEGPRVSAVTNYLPIKAQVLPLSAHFGFVCGDALIATSWDTVEIVCANKSFHDYFYLVQDYEPYFFPRGSESLEAEHTYTANLKTICASSWLDGIMRSRFNRTSTYFELSYNSTVYNCKQVARIAEARNEELEMAAYSQDEYKPIFRIAFYARSRTDRRAVSLALKGLEKLRQENYVACIELFGEHQGKVFLPPNVIGHDNGILTEIQLAELYHSCDIGLTFSATNYALVPQEMMACGLPVIEIDNESTRAIYPEGVLLLAMPCAQGIANAIEELVTDSAKRKEIARKGLEWVQKTSWKLSLKRVECFIQHHVINAASRYSSAPSVKERYLAQNHKVLKKSETDNYSVTVVIPTYQGGTILHEVVDKVNNQATAGPFEIIILDSGSTDGSIENMPKPSNMSIFQIDKIDFQHGKTRNLGISLSKSPLVAFLTQDAIPANTDWLSNLIKPLQENHEAQAVFGAHRAHRSHPNYLDELLIKHFKGFEGREIQRKSVSLQDYYAENPSFRQFMHYYSDNNSCLRKECWLSYPYPDIVYGEDQLWSDWIIQNDGVKVFAPDAIVFHSHNYTEDEEYERAKTEAFFFLKYFGYELGQDRIELEVGLEREAMSIINSTELDFQAHKEHRLALIRSKREGYSDSRSQYVNWLKSIR